MTSEDFKKIRASVPTNPGVYHYIDASGVILYVGKAKNLRNRLQSYFTNTKTQLAKTKIMVHKAVRIEYTLVNTEQDALLLENNLIKEHQPKYNIQLKDGKSYPFICIKKEPFPRVFLTRNMIKDGSEYFGPYVSTQTANVLIELITRLFPLRTCKLNLSKKNIEANKYKICLEYHIGNCLGPCEQLQEQAAYDAQIDQIRYILKGNLKPVVQHLTDQLLAHEELLEFEAANNINNQIKLLKAYQGKSVIVSQKLENVDVYAVTENKNSYFISYLKVAYGSIIQTKTTQFVKKLDEPVDEVLQFAISYNTLTSNPPPTELILPHPISFVPDNMKITIPEIGEKKQLLQLAMKNALFAKQEATVQAERLQGRMGKNKTLEILQKDLRLKEIPYHIECFDNSNLQGSNPTASTVVFKNGKPAKNDYRHYNIKTVEGPDDFASMEEIVYRRYKRLLEEDQALPQLVVIDGGKGQLSSAMKSIDKLGLRGQLAILGIAKRLEELYFPEDQVPLYLSKKSPSLKLIQHIRDESHRFAITFHRQKRSLRTHQSELENIKGIGPGSIDKLLQHFKSVKKLKEASEEEIAIVVGKAKAALLVKQL